MFATHSNAVPLSVIAPSSPHSLSNFIKVQTLEHKDHVRLYPRGDTVHEEVLLTTTTFQHPHLDDWITVINNRYIQTSGFPDFKERTIEHFDFLKSFLFEKLKKPIVTLMKYEGLYVKRFVTMVILGQRWMDFDAVRADVRSQQGDQWTRMEHYLTVLKSLCDNEELKKYQEVHKFLVNSFKGAKERLKVILVRQPAAILFATKSDSGII
ncbi:hypothetical protein H0H93_013644 [Arthromyces matolae]|nr:hypothetical protein H0H93_013644 [Arthromyces matolae]